MIGFRLCFILSCSRRWPSRWAGTWPASIEGKPCGLDRALGWLERGIYRVAGVDPQQEMGWRQYAVAVLLFNAVGFLAVYALLRLQGVLPLNPQGFPANTPDLAFNTAASFATNTNWQSYGGETTMSYLSQMLGLTVQNFVSAASGHGRAGGADSRPGAAHRRRRSATSGSTSCGRRSTSCCRCRSSWRWCWCRRASFRTSSRTRRSTLLQPIDGGGRHERDRRRRWRWARRRRRLRSSSSAPTAAGSSTSTRRIRSRIPRRCRTSSRCWRSC